MVVAVDLTAVAVALAAVAPAPEAPERRPVAAAQVAVVSVAPVAPVAHSLLPVLAEHRQVLVAVAEGPLERPGALDRQGYRVLR